MDFIDMIVDTSDEYLTGYYYSRRPKCAEDGRVTFMYKQHNPNSRIFDTVLGNVKADKATYAISTNDDCGFVVGAYIITQNGLIWEIVEVVKNEEVGKKNDALRWFKKAVNAECNIRMIEVDDLYDQKQAYETYCEVRLNFNTPIDSFVAVESLSLTKEPLPYNFVEGTDKKSVVFETRKNMAVSVDITLPNTRIKKIQIPAYKTVENEVTLEYNIKEV